MQIKTAAVVASLPALGALAAPTGSSGQCPACQFSDTPAATFPSAYGLIVGTNIQPFHFESFNANSGKFWLNLPETSSSCPESVPSCPPGTDTVFRAAGDLATAVPGGQQVYVSVEGALLFTQAHGNEVPEGAVSSPFTYNLVDGAQYGTVSTEAFGAKGFMACPTPGSVAYQVFVNMPNAIVPLGNVKDCVPVEPLAIPYTQANVAAWQYN
jgi:hypothetical protein